MHKIQSLNRDICLDLNMLNSITLLLATDPTKQFGLYLHGLKKDSSSIGYRLGREIFAFKKLKRA